MDRLRAMQVFVKIVDAGSLSAAARALDISLPAVVRTLASLERHLGARLLNRTTRRINLTDAGSRYYERSREILAQVEETELEASGATKKPSGTLSLTAPVLYGRINVMPIVAEYRRRFPDVAVRLMLLDRNVNLLEEGLDLAIRIGHLEDSSLVAAPLGTVRRVAYASPAYLRKHGTPRHPRDLVQHACLTFTALNEGDHWQFREDRRRVTVKVRPGFSSNVGDAVIAMAQSDQGIALALSYQVEQAVKAGRLRLILEEFEPEPLPVSALYPHGRLTAATVREFISLLTAQSRAATTKPATASN